MSGLKVKLKLNKQDPGAAPHQTPNAAPQAAGAPSSSAPPAPLFHHQSFGVNPGPVAVKHELPAAGAAGGAAGAGPKLLSKRKAPEGEFSAATADVQQAKRQHTQENGQPHQLAGAGAAAPGGGGAAPIRFKVKMPSSSSLAKPAQGSTAGCTNPHQINSSSALAAEGLLHDVVSAAGYGDTGRAPTKAQQEKSRKAQEKAQVKQDREAQRAEQDMMAAIMGDAFGMKSKKIKIKLPSKHPAAPAPPGFGSSAPRPAPVPGHAPLPSLSAAPPASTATNPRKVRIKLPPGAGAPAQQPQQPQQAAARPPAGSPPGAPKQPAPAVPSKVRIKPFKPAASLQPGAAAAAAAGGAAQQPAQAGALPAGSLATGDLLASLEATLAGVSVSSMGMAGTGAGAAKAAVAKGRPRGRAPGAAAAAAGRPARAPKRSRASFDDDFDTDDLEDEDFEPEARPGPPGRGAGAFGRGAARGAAAAGAGPPLVLSGPRLQLLMSKVLEGVSKKDASQNNIFKAPVTDDIAPGYSEKIKQPMCFDVMREKLASGQYRTWELFEADLSLVFDNAQTYNPPEAFVHHHATYLREVSHKYLIEAKKGNTNFRGVAAGITRKFQAEWYRKHPPQRGAHLGLGLMPAGAAAAAVLGAAGLTEQDAGAAAAAPAREKKVRPGPSGAATAKERHTRQEVAAQNLAQAASQAYGRGLRQHANMSYAEDGVQPAKGRTGRQGRRGAAAALNVLRPIRAVDPDAKRLTTVYVRRNEVEELRDAYHLAVPPNTVPAATWRGLCGGANTEGTDYSTYATRALRAGWPGAVHTNVASAWHAHTTAAAATLPTVTSSGAGFMGTGLPQDAYARSVARFLGRAHGSVRRAVLTSRLASCATVEGVVDPPPNAPAPAGLPMGANPQGTPAPGAAAGGALLPAGLGMAGGSTSLPPGLAAAAAALGGSLPPGLAAALAGGSAAGNAPGGLPAIPSLNNLLALGAQGQGGAAGAGVGQATPAPGLSGGGAATAAGLQIPPAAGQTPAASGQLPGAGLNPSTLTASMLLGPAGGGLPSGLANGAAPAPPAVGAGSGLLPSAAHAAQLQRPGSIGGGSAGGALPTQQPGAGHSLGGAAPLAAGAGGLPQGPLAGRPPLGPSGVGLKPMGQVQPPPALPLSASQPAQPAQALSGLDLLSTAALADDAITKLLQQAPQLQQRLGAAAQPQPAAGGGNSSAGGAANGPGPGLANPAAQLPAALPAPGAAAPGASALQPAQPQQQQLSAAGVGSTLQAALPAGLPPGPGGVQASVSAGHQQPGGGLVNGHLPGHAVTNMPGPGGGQPPLQAQLQQPGGPGLLAGQAGVKGPRSASASADGSREESGSPLPELPPASP